MESWFEVPSSSSPMQFSKAFCSDQGQACLFLKIRLPDKEFAFSIICLSCFVSVGDETSFSSVLDLHTPSPQLYLSFTLVLSFEAFLISCFQALHADEEFMYTLYLFECHWTFGDWTTQCIIWQHKRCSWVYPWVTWHLRHKISEDQGWKGSKSSKKGGLILWLWMVSYLCVCVCKCACVKMCLCLYVYLCVYVCLLVRSEEVMLFLGRKVFGNPVCRTRNLFVLGIFRGNLCFTKIYVSQIQQICFLCFV